MTRSSTTSRRQSDVNSGFNPPKYVIEAAKQALERVDCNQYAPTKVIPWIKLVTAIIALILVQGRPRLKKAISAAYSPFFGRDINPDTEIVITSGANEGILSALMGFLDPGDEVILFEPFFDQ